MYYFKNLITWNMKEGEREIEFERMEKKCGIPPCFSCFSKIHYTKLRFIKDRVFHYLFERNIEKILRNGGTLTSDQ
jgi:hypothetical protein